MTDRAALLESVLTTAKALLDEHKYLTVSECEALKQPVGAGNRLRDAVGAVSESEGSDD